MLQWLWTKGLLLATPPVGWSPPELDGRWDLTGQGGDPWIIVQAARGGHVACIEFLVNSVGIPLGKRLFVEYFSPLCRLCIWHAEVVT